MASKTVVEEFDGNGKLIKRTITTQEDEFGLTPTRPLPPLQPWIEPKPWWDDQGRIYC